jgi:hypothetical protein
MSRRQNGKRHTLTSIRANCSQRGECWLWKLAVNAGGYPQVHDTAAYAASGRRRTVLARRVAYELKHGALFDGARVVMTCANRLCMNPSHMQAMGFGESMAHHATLGAWNTPRAKLAQRLTLNRLHAARGVKTKPVPASNVFSYAEAA